MQILLVHLISMYDGSYSFRIHVGISVFVAFFFLQTSDPSLLDKAMYCFMSHSAVLFILDVVYVHLFI